MREKWHVNGSQPAKCESQFGESIYTLIKFLLFATTHLMTKTISLRFTLLLSAVLFSLSLTAHSFAVDSADDLQWSVRRLNTWLGDSKEAIGWRKYLLLNVLESQAGKGHQADYATLSMVRQRFASDAAGVDHPAFVDVRNAIDRHLYDLSSSYQGDLSSIMMAHIGRFKPISERQFEQARDVASYNLSVLKKYYRATLRSRPRADLFYDLQLDPLMEFIESLEFTRAPEISVGKLSSMIAEKKRELLAVTREIDALPDEETDGPVPDEEERDGDKDDDDKPIQLDDSEPEDSGDGPVPDDSTDLEDLKKQQAKLEAALDKINDRRKDVLKVDRPRLVKRRDTLRKMRAFSQRFDDVARKQFDPYFVTAASSLESLIQTYANGTADNLQEDMLRRMETLTEELPRLGLPNERRSAGRVGNLLRWFENSGQIPSMVSAIRRDYSQPNLYLNVSSNLINQAAAQSSVDTRVLDENVDGRRIRGYATTRTNVSLELLDDPNQVHVNIHLLGDISSDTRFRERKFYGFVNANGRFEGRRSLYANVGGLFASSSKVNANVGADFLGLTTKCNLIQQLAYKQFYKGKAKADAGASSRAESEAFGQFDSLTSDAVTGGQEAIFNARDRATDFAAWIPDLYLRSSSDFIEAVGKMDSAGTLAAPDAPAATTVPSDVVVRLHDSLLSNLIDPIFAGKTFTNEELAARAAELTGNPAPDMTDKDEDPEDKKDEDKEDEDEDEEKDESFSITFDSVRPIQFEFDDNALTVSISGKQFAQGDRKINAGLQIKVRFKIKQTASGLQLVRDGDAEIEYTDPDKKDAKIVAFKSFLEDRLNSEARTEATIDLPANLLPVDQVDALKSSKIARELQLVQCSIDDGWFYLGWRHIPGSLGSMGFATDLSAIWNEVVVDQYQTDFYDQPQSVLSTDENEPPAPIVEGVLELQ